MSEAEPHDLLVGSARVDDRVRDLIVCPACRGALTDGDGFLICTSCAVQYPVVGGVPWLAEDLSAAWPD